MTAQTVLWMFPVLLGLIFLGFPVAFSMMIAALGFGLLRFGGTLVHQFAQRVDDLATNYVLGAIPLFIFMGSILERAGIAEKLFDALYMWTRRLPGGLAVAALLMCTIFAAASGVVGATETLVGMLAIPAMTKRRYDNSLIAGTICGGGSLGTIIPPSVPVVVLAPIAAMSIGDLLAGILIPGLLMSALFIVYILIICTLKPALAPPETEPDPRSLAEKIKFTLIALIPPAFLIFTVLGTLFMGLATPTEAAACGCLGVLLLAIIYRRMSWSLMFQAALQTVSLTAMILAIILAGGMFSGVFFASGGMSATKAVLDAFGLSPWSVDRDHPFRRLHPRLPDRFDLDHPDHRSDRDPAGEELRDRPTLVRGGSAGDAADGLSDAAHGPVDLLLEGDRAADDEAQAHVLGRHPLHLLPVGRARSADRLPGAGDMDAQGHVWQLTESGRWRTPDGRHETGRQGRDRYRGGLRHRA